MSMGWIIFLLFSTILSLMFGIQFLLEWQEQRQWNDGICKANGLPWVFKQENTYVNRAVVHSRVYIAGDQRLDVFYDSDKYKPRHRSK